MKAKCKNPNYLKKTKPWLDLVWVKNSIFHIIKATGTKHFLLYWMFNIILLFITWLAMVRLSFCLKYNCIYLLGTCSDKCLLEMWEYHISWRDRIGLFLFLWKLLRTEVDNDIFLLLDQSIYFKTQEFKSYRDLDVWKIWVLSWWRELHFLLCPFLRQTELETELKRFFPCYCKGVSL